MAWRVCIHHELPGSSLDSWWVSVQLYCLLTLLAAGFDTSVHISEEARNAPRAVPFAIMCATILSSVVGWSEWRYLLTYVTILDLALAVVNIVLSFHAGSDLQIIIENPIGQPMATVCSQQPPVLITPYDIDLQIFANSVGSTGTVVIWAFMVITLFITGMDYVCTFHTLHANTFLTVRSIHFSW